MGSEQFDTITLVFAVELAVYKADSSSERGEVEGAHQFFSI